MVGDRCSDVAAANGAGAAAGFPGGGDGGWLLQGGQLSGCSASLV